MTDEPPLPAPRYERTDADPRLIAGLAAALAALTALGIVGGIAALGWPRGHPPAGPSSRAAATSFETGPTAQTATARSWERYVRETRAHLDGYGWIDRRAGIVRVPIDRAIDLLCPPAGAAPAP
jgi:hypothetical protein